MPKDIGYPKGNNASPKKGPLNTPFERTMDVPGKATSSKNPMPKSNSKAKPSY